MAGPVTVLQNINGVPGVATLGGQDSSSTPRVFAAHFLTNSQGVEYSSGSPFPVTLGGAQAVTGTFWQATQPVSFVSQPLPTGAATSAKQAALGTAGTPSSDVLTVQGAVGAIPLGTLASGSTGTDYSATGAAGAITAAQATTLLVTIPATAARAACEVQNQSAATISIVRDDGAGANQSLILLSGTGAGAQGGGWSSTTFKGRVRVYGASGAQVSAFQE